VVPPCRRGATEERTAGAPPPPLLGPRRRQSTSFPVHSSTAPRTIGACRYCRCSPLNNDNDTKYRRVSGASVSTRVPLQYYYTIKCTLYVCTVRARFFLHLHLVLYCNNNIRINVCSAIFSSTI